MDKDLARSLFLKAREQYDSAVRIVLLVIAAVFLFHLLTLSPYLAWTRELPLLKAKLERATKARDNLENISADLNAMSQDSQKQLKMLGDELYKNLISDFAGLDAAVAAVQHGNPNPPSDGHVQAMGLGSLEGPSFRLADVTGALKDANKDGSPDVPQERIILRPIISQQIIAPRFTQIDQAWRSYSGQKIEAKADQLANKTLDDTLKLIMTLDKQTAGDAPERIKALQRGLLALKETAADIRLTPPIGTKWWETPAEKSNHIAGIEESTAKQLPINRTKDQSKDLLRDLNDSVDYENDLLGGVQRHVSDVEEMFKSQQAKLADIAKPFQFVPLDLDVVTSDFPLLLGLFFGAAFCWLTIR